MPNNKLRRYLLLSSLGFVVAIAAGFFMFMQFRSMLANYSGFSKRIHNENVEHLCQVILANMAEYMEKQYPFLSDTQMLREEAGTEWFWDTADEWREIADVFDLAYIYYIEKKDDNYVFLFSSDIRRDYHPEWLHDWVWTDAPPAFYDEAWETKQLTVSPEPYSDGWGTLITAARPILSHGEVVGILGVDHDVSFIESIRRQELQLEVHEGLLMDRMRKILVAAVVVILLLLGYQVWLSNTTVLVPLQDVEADEQTRIMLDATPMICSLWNMNGTAIDCNMETVRVFGLTDKSEFLEHFFELSPEYQPNGGKSLDLLRKAVKTALEKGYTRFEWLHRTRLGNIPVETTIVRVPWKNSFRLAAYSRDLREEKAKAAALLETAEDLSQVLALVEASKNIIMILGADGTIEYMNPEVSEASGFSPEELKRDGLRSIFSPGDFEELKEQHIAAALRNQLVNFESPIAAKNGYEKDFIFSAFAVPLHDGNTGVGVLGRDITKSKQMQRDLAAAKEQAERALANEIQYNKAKSDFLSRVSHELRTPLNIIVGMTKIARTAVNADEMGRCWANIDESTEHLLELVNDILDMTGFDTGRFNFFPCPFNFTKAMASVIDSVTRKSLAKEQIFVTDIDTGIHETMEGDERRLKQILLKLLSNAVKFTPEKGSIELHARMIEDDGKECTLRFEIIDSGIGISPEMLGRMWDVFEQIDTSTTREYGGMGLSLPLTKRIVDLMHGELRVESEMGKGSRFTCDVRLGVVEDGRGDTNIKSGENENDDGAIEGISPDLSGKRVMVVDDVNLNREILIMLLEHTGAVLDEASTGDEAVRMFERDKYDLVLMDLHMPVMDGYIATKNIRASGRPWAKSVPVIAISAESSGDVHLKCIEAGITDHLSKPVEIEDLLRTIAKWMPLTSPE